MTPRNDPAQDYYKPAPVGKVEFETWNFEEIEVDDLLWLNTDTNEKSNNVCRKINENQVKNLKKGTVHNLDKYQKVYQKI